MYPFLVRGGGFGDHELIRGGHDVCVHNQLLEEQNVVMISAKNLSIMLAVVQVGFAYPAVAERWIYRGKYTDAASAKYGVSSKGYIDIDSIRVEDGLIRYWSKDEIISDDKPDVVSIEKLESHAVNCKRRTMAWTA